MPDAGENQRNSLRDTHRGRFANAD